MQCRRRRRRNISISWYGEHSFPENAFWRSEKRSEREKQIAAKKTSRHLVPRQYINTGSGIVARRRASLIPMRMKISRRRLASTSVAPPAEMSNGITRQTGNLSASAWCLVCPRARKSYSSRPASLTVARAARSSSIYLPISFSARASSS